MIEKFFHLEENQTTLGREIRGGIVTFMTMAYIIFVQPAVLKGAGMDFGAVMASTCIAAALGTLLMGWIANYPIALAPCMGENFFFVSVVAGAATGQKVAWQSALACVFISGLLFFILSIFKLRSKIVDAIPRSLKFAIPAGIGLFIALLGLKGGGLVRFSPFSLELGDLSLPATQLFLIGLFLTSALMVRKVSGALLLGILATALIGHFWGITEYTPGAWGILDAPPNITPVLFALDFSALLDLAMIPVIFIFLFMVMFDTLGTLIGVSEQAGLMKDGNLPRMESALVADSSATTLGALLGNSTVSAYIESSAGVAEGARTGLANVVTALLFLGALFFLPLVKMIALVPAILAPALVLVGSMMMRGLQQIDWEDMTESFPAFLLIVGIPFTYSIADGIAVGFISYAFLKLVSGRRKEAGLLVYVLSLLLIGMMVLKFVKLA